MVSLVSPMTGSQSEVTKRSIVNGLRDDDTESLYASRTSFASEYSVREGTDEGVQVFFKEHARKNSGASFPRKKPLPGMARPETKVRTGYRSVDSFSLAARSSTVPLHKLVALSRTSPRAWRRDLSIFCQTSFLATLHPHPFRKPT